MSFLLPAVAHAVTRLKWVVADVVDAVLNWWAPLHDFDRPFDPFSLPEDELGGWEQEFEVFEPDELWHAMQRHPAGKGRTPDDFPMAW